MGVAARLGLTWPVLLRVCMHQDPDVVMIGELRDAETAQLAVQIALTGHLVLSSFWTNDAAATLTALGEMGLQRYLLSLALRGVLAQRLARRLCDTCKQPADLEPAVLEYVREQAAAGGWLLPDESSYHRPVGCEACRGTGYRGRIGLFELLEMDGTLRNAVLERAPEEELRSLAIAQGMHSLAADGIRKAAGGITTVDEVVRTLAL
jgi:general secretion pathway protein E